MTGTLQAVPLLCEENDIICEEKEETKKIDNIPFADFREPMHHSQMNHFFFRPVSYAATSYNFSTETCMEINNFS